MKRWIGLGAILALSACATGEGVRRPLDVARALSRAACRIEPILETVEVWTSGAEGEHVASSTTAVRGFRIVVEEPKE